jgi:hypothetical protein
MQKKRLLKLADLLDTVPVKRFTLRIWATPGFTETDCGTAACACGWATTIFPELTLSQTPGYDKPRLRPALQKEHLTDGEAIERFFGLPISDDFDAFAYLFEVESYPSRNPRPKTVAKRIRHFVETGRATS